MVVGAMAFIGTLLIPFGTACDLLNFGALLGFMGVNLSSFASYYLHPAEGHCRHFLRDAFCPVLLAFSSVLCFGLICPTRQKLLAGHG